MKLILDASIAVKWFLPEPDSPKALVLRNDFQMQIHALLSPDIFPVEVAHALTKAERRGILPQGDALSRTADILAAGPELCPYLPLLPRAVELACHARIGVYDCIYVALAEREKCELVSADRRLVNTFPRLVIPLSSL